MRYFSFLGLLLASVTFMGSQSFAEGNNVTTKISEYNTASLFSEANDYVESELIIKFKPTTTLAKKKAIIESVQGKEKSNLKFNPISLISVPKSEDLTLLAQNLLNYPEVEYVEPNIKVDASYTPKDSSYGKQWHLKKIQMSKAWDSTKGSSKVKVAVIDGGVQKDHPEFKGKIVDPYNMVTDSTSYKSDSHGTHVAGIIAASTNGSGTVGVAPGVKIMPINVFDGESAEVYDIAEAVYYAVYYEANVINLSLVSYVNSSVLEEAISFAKDEGVVVVAAAGNDDTYRKSYPASYEDVIAVSATTDRDRIADFSNFGSYIDIAAPGVDIFSTYTGKKYKYMDGTSMAAPVVSGVSALMISKNPFITPNNVRDILKKSTVDLGRKGWDSLYGYGRIDAYKALKNTPTPVKDLKVEETTYTTKGVNTNLISFTPLSSKTVNVYIQDSKGNHVRKLVTNKKSDGKKISTKWDGKLDSGSYASSGTYEVVVKLSNSKKNFYKKKAIKFGNKVKPSITLDGTETVFSPNIKKLIVPVKLNESAKVTAKVYDTQGKLIKTLWNQKSLSGGKKYNVEWDGNNASGVRVKDAFYKLQFSVIDSSKISGSAKTIKVEVDTNRPTGNITLTKELFQFDGTNQSVGNIEINEDLTVTSYIKNEAGKEIAKVHNNTAIKLGTTPIYWNGKTDQGELVEEGKYQIHLEFKDKAGNTSSIISNTFDVQDWTVPKISSNETFDYKQGDLLIPYNVTKPGEVTIYILKDFNIIRTLLSNDTILKGDHSITWDGKDQAGNTVANGVYSFKIILKDSYGLIDEFTGEIQINR